MARSIAFLVVTVLIPSPFVGGSPTGNRPALIKAADVPIATVDSVTTGTNVVFDSAPTDSVDWKFKFDIHAKAHPAYVAPKGTDFHVPNEAFCALDLSAPMARLWHLSRTDLFNLMTWALYIPERQVWSVILVRKDLEAYVQLDYAVTIVNTVSVVTIKTLITKRVSDDAFVDTCDPDHTT